jgi:hypothetical protein
MTDSATFADIHNRSPHFIAPRGTRPETIVDNHNVFLIDPDGNFIGVDSNWGRGGPLARVLYAGRSGTRDL